MLRYLIYINLIDPTTGGAEMNFNLELDFGEPLADHITLPGGFILTINSDECTSYPLFSGSTLVGKVICSPYKTDPNSIKELIAHLRKNGWYYDYGVAYLEDKEPILTR